MESACRGKTPTVGSNPTLSAIPLLGTGALRLSPFLPRTHCPRLRPIAALWHKVTGVSKFFGLRLKGGMKPANPL